MYNVVTTCALLLWCFFVPVIVTSSSDIIISNNNNNIRKGDVNLGTTLLAIKYNNGIIVAADTRTSIGTYVSHRYAHKIVPISNNCNTVIARSGSAADTQYLSNIIQIEYTNQLHRYGTQLSVYAIAHYLRILILKHNIDMASLLVAGIDNNDNDNAIPRIYSIAISGALIEHEQYASSGSGSIHINGYIEKYLNDHESHYLSEEDAITLCINALQIAIQMDGGSGGLIRLHIINKNNQTREERTIIPSTKTLVLDNDNVSTSTALKGFAPPRPVQRNNNNNRIQQQKKSPL